MNKDKYIIIAVFAFLTFGFMSCKSNPEVKPKEPETVVSKVEEPQSSSVPEKQKVEPETVKPKKTDPNKRPAELAISKANKLALECKKLGIDSTFSKEFALANKDMELAKKYAQSENFSSAKNSALSATDKFQTLLYMDSALKSKTEIDNNNFAGYSAEDYSSAEIDYMKAKENFTRNIKNALKYAKNSDNLYSKVLDKGYAEWLSTSKESAKNAKEKCDSIKADKSASKAYAEALKTYKAGQLSERKKDFQNASKQYSEAAKAFTKIYDLVSVKRQAALEALQSAKEKQEISSKLAAEADKEAPLPSKKSNENTEGGN